MFSLFAFLKTANAEYLMKNFKEIRKMVGGFFDIQKLFSNDRIFSDLGKILCGKAFPRSEEIRFISNVLYSPDYNGPDKDEVDAMPSELIAEARGLRRTTKYLFSIFS